MSINFQKLFLDESELSPIQKALYDAEEPGYFVFRNFLSPIQTEHIVNFWTECKPEISHQLYPGRKLLFEGCPNYYGWDDRANRTFFNFFWNEPADPLTYSVAQQIQFLRNRIEGRPSYREFFPLENRSATYRVVISRNGDSFVPPHRDWVGKDLDVKRTQMTLFLSEKGKDYSGRAFVLENNQGKKLSFGTDVLVKAGDLVVWRYNNEHSVESVTSVEAQKGFVRILFPPELFKNQISLLDKQELFLKKIRNWMLPKPQPLISRESRPH